MSTRPPSPGAHGLVVEVVGGPMEGLGLAQAAGDILIGRGQQCTLALAGDPWLSRTHARIGRDENGLFAQDEGGRNGTWLPGGRISGRVRIRDGEILVVGRTPMQVALAGGPFDQRRADPLPELAPAIRALLDAATAIARGRSTPFVDTGDLLAALLASKDAAVRAALAGIGSAAGRLAEVAGHPWTGERAWIAEMAAEGAGDPGSGPPVPTPKVVRVIRRAHDLAAEHGRHEPGAPELLAALALEPRGPVAEALAAAGLRAEPLLGRLAGTGAPVVPPSPEPPTAGAAEPGPVTDEIPTAPGKKRAAASAEAPSLFELESWDVFRQAKELADRIRAVQAVYHLADPDQRRQAIEEVLAGEFERLVPERRDQVLRHLAEFFPLPEGGADQAALEDEVGRLRAENSRLAALVSQQAPPPAAPDRIDLSSLLQRAPAGVAEDDAVRSLRAVLRFAMDVERFTSSVVQSFQSRAADLTRYVIPPFRRDLKDLLQDLARGGEEDLSRHLESYLTAVRQWLVASLVGYSRAASTYCREILERLDPRAIERTAEVPRWKDAMGLSDAELWKRYKEVYADLTPDLVDDQVQERAAAQAGREVERLRQTPDKGEKS